MADELDENVLQDYLEGNLDPASREQVAAHLAQSAADRQRLAALESLLAAFAEMEEVPLERDLASPILATIQAQTAPTVPGWLHLLPWLQLAAAALLLLFFWTTWQSQWRLLRAAFVDAAAAVPLPDVTIWQSAQAWTTAVWQNIHLTPPQFNLPAYQWGWLLALTLIIWLLGNRLIFPPRNGGSHG